jgi:hypothetical protein
MDLNKVKPSKNFEDRTNQFNDPMIKWLMRQPSSKSELTDEEKDLLSTGNWNVADLYFMRYFAGNDDVMLKNNYYDVYNRRKFFRNK